MVFRLLSVSGYAGFGEFNPGEWCRFCRANGVCKAQANIQLSAFDDFKSAGAIKEADALTLEEIGDALENGKTLIAWYESLQKVALDKLHNATRIPGYKVVEGKSIRTCSNQDKALETLESNGIEHAIIYDTAVKQNIDSSIESAAKDTQGKLWNGIRPLVMPIPIHDGDGVRENGTPYGKECWEYKK